MRSYPIVLSGSMSTKQLLRLCYINAVFIKLFKTNNFNIAWACQYHLSFHLSVQVWSTNAKTCVFGPHSLFRI